MSDTPNPVVNKCLTTEEREAAERLRKNEYPPGRAGTPQRLTDRHILAEAYLREHPADDAEPVTAEWLEAAGFKRVHDDDYRLHGQDSGELLLQIVGLDEPPPYAAHPGGNCDWPFDIYTRAQVRNLVLGCTM